MSVVNILLFLLTADFLTETDSLLILRNTHFRIEITKNNNNIAGIKLGKGNLISEPCTFVSNTFPFSQNFESKIFTEQRSDYGKIIIERKYRTHIFKQKFLIDSAGLYWEVSITNRSKVTSEVNGSFIIPIINNIEHIFQPGYPYELNLENLSSLTVNYRKDIFLPVFTVLNHSKNFGLSIIASPEIEKPSLFFTIRKKKLIVSCKNLLGDKKNTIKFGIHLVIHPSDWRGGLNFFLNRYPEYFSSHIRLNDGLYYLANPFDKNKKIEQLKEQGVAWIELHGYFPFYGLYVPESKDWGLISNSDRVSISEWKDGAGRKRNSCKDMQRLISLWHKYGIKVYLYFQVFEAWHQYAKRYFPPDIAKDENGNPLPSWKYTNLMNPDPKSSWGRYIIGQAKKLIKRYPEVDGIFYDRMDYNKFDFAHKDGVTMKNARPAYMLGFALERMNKKIFDIFHNNNKGIWGNGPTSIEVCKGLDGIMAEGNILNLYRLQYLCLTRPLIYFPHDRKPDETEEKLKNSIFCGASPAVTSGGKICQRLDDKYRPLFELLKSREWALNTRISQIPAGLKSNIFKTPDADYIIVIMNPEKSQLGFHPFDYNIPISIQIPDNQAIKYAYFLSGDWYGVNKIDFKKALDKIKIRLPSNLATSLIYLTRKIKYNLTRLSSPILIKGVDNEISFTLEKIDPGDITLQTPWSIKRKTASHLVKFKIKVPADARGEEDFVVIYKNKRHKFSFWLVDPVDIIPGKDIFIRFKEGEKIPFYVVNNLNRTVSINGKVSSINTPNTLFEINQLSLKPQSSKLIDIYIPPEDSGFIQAELNFDDLIIKRRFKVHTALFHSKDDLFFDDFKNGMKRWTIIRGKWRTTAGKVKGSGSSHFAFIKTDWQNYKFEVMTRCLGSKNPSVTWLKAYIFFRLQDEKNFYRFGIHGDYGIVDLFKCVDGKWIRLGTRQFLPEREKWYVLRVDLQNDIISGYLDGKKVIEVRDRTFTRGGIGIGVLEDDMVCEYQNIVVKPQ